MNGRASHRFRDKRRNTRILLGSLIVISLLFYFVNRGNDDSFQTARNNAEGVGAKILTYFTLPVRGFENFAGDIRDRFNAHAQNEELRQEIIRLREIEAHANNLAIKLADYEDILNVEAGSDIPEVKVAARAVSEVNGPFARTALLNVGYQDGVKIGDAVMTADGMFGHIIRTGNSSSRVLKLEDLNSRIAVMSKATQARAILMGDNTRLPILSYVSLDSEWAVGDEVLTSGDDGLLPAGLPIGEVIADEEGRMKVRLFVNRSFVDWVWVYPYQPMKKPEEDPVELTLEDNLAGPNQTNDGEAEVLDEIQMSEGEGAPL